MPDTAWGIGAKWHKAEQPPDHPAEASHELFSFYVFMWSEQVRRIGTQNVHRALFFYVVILRGDRISRSSGWPGDHDVVRDYLELTTLPLHLPSAVS